MTIRLKPMLPEAKEYDWYPASSFSCKRYALVGKCSGAIHAMFDADSEDMAFDILEYYSKKRKDSGYELMEVEQIVKCR